MRMQVILDSLSFPAKRDQRLQNLARGDEGFVLALGYSTQRGYGGTHPFAGELANPRQFTAFTYGHSPAVLEDDPAFAGGPPIGAVVPDVRETRDHPSSMFPWRIR